MPMGMLAEPLTERAKITARERLLERTHRTLGRGEQLRGVDVAKRVRREITDETFRPVSVLKATGSIVARRDAEVFLIQLAPCAGQIASAKVAREQRPLELESNQNVQIVRHFVGLHAND